MTGIGDFLFHSRPLWGIDGPTWLVLMGVGLGVGFALWRIADFAGKVRAHKGIREATERPQGWAVQTAASMPPQHAAYLCGGRRRVTDLAFAELEMAGALTTQEHTNDKIRLSPEVTAGTGSWAPGVAGPAQGLSPAATTMLEGARPHGMINQKTRSFVIGEVETIRRELADAGLVSPHRIHPHSAMALAAFGMYFLISVIRTIIAAGNGRPVEGMVIILFLSLFLVIGIASFRRFPLDIDDQLTERGIQVRGALEAEVSRLGGTVAMLPDRRQGLMLVAVGGLAAAGVVSPLLLDAYDKFMWSGTIGGGDGSSTSGCGSGGDGGCGGGGCGGCGS
ncbi:TIGR04222 domain-containing membrane protein [Corynebacterium freneyi]|uniref:TIGR04222 domain-containing membrane protein n=1 Tax=Corynebacterium freneyi DNF00450 TaxID=1287475 RepID=A0A095ZBX0_9CORY|nr:TIGR04222 domain-containing membrane protein [Corynebacterium freneyi]KGF16207.1 hypothetical protein HMPREF1650_08880 [Corynebacterium freneyi DNF00450]